MLELLDSHIPRLDDPEYKKCCYRTFYIPKSNGKKRQIKTPCDWLKKAQAQYIEQYVKPALGEPHPAAHGFVPGKGTVTAMNTHVSAGSNWLVKLDVSNFFPSITKKMLYNLFLSSFTPGDADLLATLFTDETDHMTQGCISSPYLANMVLYTFDMDMKRYCDVRGYVYTRYADDMQVSCYSPVDVKGLVAYVDDALTSLGLTMNKSKTKQLHVGGKAWCLGLMMSADKRVTIGWRKKNYLKVVCHKLEVGEPIQDSIKTWKGRLNYYMMVEPEYFSQPRFDILRNWEVANV